MGWVLLVTVVFHGHITSKIVNNDIGGRYTIKEHCLEDLWLLKKSQQPVKGATIYASCEEEYFFLWRDKPEETD